MVPIIKAAESNNNFNYSLVLSGNHINKKFGETISEAILDNIKNIIKLDITNNYREPANMAISISIVIKKLTQVIQKLKSC